MSYSVHCIQVLICGPSCVSKHNRVVKEYINPNPEKYVAGWPYEHVIGGDTPPIEFQCLYQNKICYTTTRLYIIVIHITLPQKVYKQFNK